MDPQRPERTSPDPRPSPLDEEASQPGRAWWRGLLEVLETFALAAVIFLGINAVSARIRIESISMVPTLEPGNYVVVEKITYRFRLPARGEVVVFDLPRDPSQRFIKRVIGIPGEEVRIQGGRVYINGQSLEEPYIRVPTNRGGTWQVPENSVFVLGDNRNNSSDSRVWGVVTADKLIGKALFVYWPPERWGALGDAAFAADIH